MKYKLIVASIVLALHISSVKSQLITMNVADGKYDNEIAFASDTQAPLWIESVFLKDNNNRKATGMIFNNIASRHPLALFLLGDIVSLGTSKKAWKPMKKYLDSCRNIGIPVHGILGNHEVMGKSDKGQRRFQTFFPNHVTTGYYDVVDSVAVVLLNSNFSTLSRSNEQKQLAWYKETIEMLDENPAVQYIIISCHHSPYSNSKLVGSSKAVQQKFVPQYIKSPKSKMFLSGHSHAFEHFKIEGKDFLVIGGGGGLHQPLNFGTGQLTDINSYYKPAFHYLTVKRFQDHLQVSSQKLKEKFDGFEVGLKFNINRFDQPKAVVETK
jgi:UDP-2,3-diacylglucosamine pyrophosphatase LpxH